MSEWRETSLGNIPIDWDINSLGELLYIKGRIGWKGLKKSEYLKEGYTIINGEQIINGKVDWKNVGRIPKERYDESPEIMLKSGDILMTKDGTIGKIALIENLPEHATVASGVFVIRKQSPRLKQKYLYYFFQSHYFNQLIKSRTEGSVIPHLYQRDFIEMEIPLPEPNEQENISKLLTKLDNKIDLLRRQNETLEAIAQTLFKRWFVEFEFPDENGRPYKSSGGEMVPPELGEIPEGWRVGKIKDFGNVVCGKTPSKAIIEYFNGDIPFIKIPDMHGAVFVIDTEDTLSEKGAKSQQTKFLPAYSINVSCIATVGLVTINSKASHTNQQINSIIPINEFYLQYLFFSLTSLSNYLKSLGSGGSATLNVNTNTFSNIDLLIPIETDIKNYHNQVSAIFKKIELNAYTIINLQKIRDSLLPKLMSGQIRITE